MVTKSDNLNISPGYVRRLLRQSRNQGRALARHEYRRLLEELANPDLFELKIDFQNTVPAPQVLSTSITDDPVAKLLPPLNVPLGTIVWAENPAKLPVIGILVPDAPKDEIRTALRALLTAHASDPFARFVFLCSKFDAIPFLGRYQFTYEYIGTEGMATAYERASIRYGLKEVRSLLGSERIWQK